MASTAKAPWATDASRWSPPSSLQLQPQHLAVRLSAWARVAMASLAVAEGELADEELFMDYFCQEPDVADEEVPQGFILESDDDGSATEQHYDQFAAEVGLAAADDAAGEGADEMRGSEGLLMLPLASPSALDSPSAHNQRCSLEMTPPPVKRMRLGTKTSPVLARNSAWRPPAPWAPLTPEQQEQMDQWRTAVINQIGRAHV